jgi:endoglucanase
LTSNFASATSRVIFDMGADTGNVAIDDVELVLDTPLPAPSNLVANGNFNNGATGWSGNALQVRTEGGNSFNFADVATVGNPYDVNLSYVVNIPTSGVRYKLRFKASSNRNRTIVAGIGLNQDPWTNVTETINVTTTQQTFELTLTSNFASATSRVIFDMGADTGNVAIDDVELVLDTAAAPAPSGGPTVGAALPTALAANVRSIFSDTYTNLTVGTWGPDWGPASARITDGVIAGNNYKTIDMLATQEFAGISFVSSKFDATAYTTFNIDYWVDAPLLAGQVINIKLSNHDGPGGETSAIQYLVNPVTAGSWQRLAIPLSSFTVAGGGTLSRNNIAEIIITAARANVATTAVKVYFDNMYFSQPSP